MKKRYLRRFINMDNSFGGCLYTKKFTGLPFDFLVALSIHKKDKIPRVHIVQINDENIAKLPDTRSYNILGPGKIERITIYHKDGFNEEWEEILRKITKIYYTEICNFFYNKDNGFIKESEIKSKIIL